jgi:hypothetical protein
VESAAKKQTNKKTKRKVVNEKFDELAKGLAQSVTRRQALKRFGLGLAGMALACFGLANRAEAQPKCIPVGGQCNRGKGNIRCCHGFGCFGGLSGSGICVPLP